MTKSQIKIDSLLSHYADESSKLKSSIEQIKKQIQALEIQKEDELDHVEASYSDKEAALTSQYLTLEQDYNRLKEEIASQYIEQFELIQEDINQIESSHLTSISEENSIYQNVVDDILNLKDRAYQQFLSMVSESEQAIDEETAVHSQFISEENQRILDATQKYAFLQSEQSNILLSSIEETRNALISLQSELSSQTSQEVSYMNETVLSVLSSLRSVKQKMNQLFRSSTNTYNSEIERISNLSNIRQKPHSLINQTLIKQYVKQIKEIRQKRDHFIHLIESELEISKKQIGNKIVQADQQNRQEDLEKYILEYQLIQNKANYLLKRNLTMSNLLISKYQNEVKKIKIDSFKRVEEIKLTYSLPASFFQNSINLYSSFSFFVNETFDTLDNLLSDFVLYHNQYRDQILEYSASSSKTIEEYKVQLLARINQICTKLSDSITEINQISSNIVTLESKNQLEIAEIRKQIESLQIKGDYEKYVLSLDNDASLAIEKHHSTLTEYDSKKEKNTQLLKVEREVYLARQNYDLETCKLAYLKKVSMLETEIHQLSYHKELTSFENTLSYMKQELIFKSDLEIHELHQSSLREAYLLALRFDEERKAMMNRLKLGSDEVIDFVNHTQKLIDLSNQNTKILINKLNDSDHDKIYAKELLKLRDEMSSRISSDFHERTKVHYHAIALIRREFEQLKTSYQVIINDFENEIRHFIYALDTKTFGDSSIDWEAYQLRLAVLLQQFHSLLTRYQANNDISIFSSILSESIAHVASLKEMVEKKESNHQTKRIIGLSIDVLSKLKLSEDKINMMLDSIFEQVIFQDIVVIKHSMTQQNKVLKQLNETYDQLIYEAVLMDANKDKQKRKILEDALLLESNFKNKVLRINRVYENSSKNEKERLHYIEKSIEQMIKEVFIQWDKNQKSIRNSQASALKSFDAKLSLYKSIYRDYIKSINETSETEISYFNQKLNESKLLLDQSLLHLQDLSTLIPKKYDETQLSLRNNQSTLFDAKRKELLEAYKEIEENKFTLTPKLNLQIEAIKERLPLDYKSLYIKMSKSQEKLLSDYMNINIDYEQEFEQFRLKKQNLYHSTSLSKTLNVPYEELLDYHQTTLQKNTDSYLESLNQTAKLKENVKNKETEYQDFMNRIIND